MIKLTSMQSDSLTELINIAFGLTAAKLSEISGDRVHLDPPTVRMHPTGSLALELQPYGSGPLTSVHEVFTGPISGRAVLLFNHADAQKLGSLLVQESLGSLPLGCSTDEILTEVGNMVLSSCLGVLGNLLHTRVTFVPPRLYLDSLDHFLSSISVDADEQQYVLVITSSFKLAHQEVAGRLLVVLGASSLKRLLQALLEWERVQAA